MLRSSLKDPGAKPRLVHVVTVPMTLEFFLRGQITYLKERGFEVIAVSSPGQALERVRERDGIAVYPVAMTRHISPLSDLASLIRLILLFRKLRPTIVHASTGKAGPLAMLAATLARVPVRIYGLRGIMVDRRTGLAGLVLRAMEHVSCRLADRVIAVSRSVADVIISGGYCDPDKLTVPAHGSSNGVDATGRFDPRLLPPQSRVDLRARYSIPSEAFVIGFIGRVVAGKGVRELEEAWSLLSITHTRVFLIIVGEAEAQDPVPEEVLQRLRNDQRVVWIDYVPNEEMPLLYSAMDLVVLPSYSEGLPNVPLEAAAMELPVVATRVTGCVDAVLDGVTGTLVPPRNGRALAEAINRYVEDGRDLQRRHGTAARIRVLREFKQESIWEAICREYLGVLEKKGLTAGIPWDAVEESGKTRESFSGPHMTGQGLKMHIRHTLDCARRLRDR